MPTPRMPSASTWLPLLALGLTLPFARLAAADGPPLPVDVPPVVNQPPMFVDAGDCRRDVYPNGQVSALTCGPKGEPMQAGSHRLEQFTGVLTTYYPNGSAHEILTLSDGFLDGLFEEYDSNGHLVQRGMFQRGVRQDLGVAFMPQVQWPPPANIALSGVHGTIRPRVDRAPPSPLDRGGLGIGLRLVNSLSHNAYTTFDQLGPIVDLLLRTPNAMLEFDLGYQGPVNNLANYNRFDIPVSLGLRWLFGQGTVRPYTVLTMGADYAWRRVPGNVQAQASETAWLFEAMAGFGLAGRMSARTAWYSDLRLGGRFRGEDPTHLHVTDDQGNQVELMASQFTGQLSLGVMWLP